MPAGLGVDQGPEKRTETVIATNAEAAHVLALALARADGPDHVLIRAIDAETGAETDTETEAETGTDTETEETAAEIEAVAVTGVAQALALTAAHANGLLLRHQKPRLL